MTFLDAPVTALDGSGRVEFHGGLGGAASRVLLNTIEAHGQGRAPGECTSATAEVRVMGAVLREILRNVKGRVDYAGSSMPEEVDDFKRSICDDQEYEVLGL